MGLGDWIKGQFIDIIEWTEPSQNEILSYRFTRHKNETLCPLTTNCTMV